MVDTLPPIIDLRAIEKVTAEKAAEILKLIFPEDKPLYTPHGKWGWIAGEELFHDTLGTPLGSRLEGQVDLNVNLVNDKHLVYISKFYACLLSTNYRTSVWDCWKSFFTSLYLNSSPKYLRPLQGDCVPWVIGVNHRIGGHLGVLLDLPHPMGWREADMFLKESQKEAIIAAYQKLHDRGILHGGVEYKHMLIGDDEKVTIIEFGLSKVMNPDESDCRAGLETCDLSCIRTEMRKVKFMLDWKDSRATEFRLANLRAAREARDRVVADSALANDKTDPFDVKMTKEPLSEEEQQHPDGGLQLSDLHAWSYGYSWTATHFKLDCHASEVVVTKSRVPRPPIPFQMTSMESTNTLKNSEESNEDPTTSAISRCLKIDHLKSTFGRLFAWQQKGQKEQKYEPENTYQSEETKEDTEGKKSKTKEQEQKNVNSKPAEIAVLRHGKADCAKVDLREQCTMEVSAKGPDVLENLTEKINTELTRTIAPRQGDTDLPRTAMKRRLEAELEEPGQRAEQTVTSHLLKMAQAINCETDKSDEPAKKRQRTVSMLQEFGGRISPNPSSEKMDSEDSDGISSFGLTSSGTSTSSGESDITHLLFNDEDADPTFYELNLEERALLRREAARAFARFTTASTRVQPRDETFQKEMHNLEKCRSELLRIIVMLPRKDRITLWTNMGQPDVRALLGLIPDAPDPNKSSLPQQAPEVARQGLGSTKRPHLGPLRRCVAPGGSEQMIRIVSERSVHKLAITHKQDAKSSTKEIIQRRLEQQNNRLSTPAPPLPTNRMCSRSSSIASQVTPVIHPQGSYLRGSTLAPQGVIHQGSASTERSAAPQYYHQYDENMRQVLDTAHKLEAHPFTVLSRRLRALEGRSTSSFDTPAGLSVTSSRSGSQGESFKRHQWQDKEET